MPAQPVIGIPTALETARYGVWEQPAALTPFGYIEAVQRAGAIVLLIPPDDRLAEDPEPILDRIDGLLLAGGCDIDPSFYGQPAHAETVNTVPQRDRIELALTRAALARDLPVLGICRGMQVLNVAAGGTLLQHVPDAVGNEEHRRHAGTFVGNGHDVELAPESLAARAAGEPHHHTLSHHHQAVDQIGDGLVISGRAVGDDLVEAIESPGRTFVLGVQWHPEADETSAVVGALVEQARAYQELYSSGWGSA
jgi:putative glutamine amidotransferase